MSARQSILKTFYPVLMAAGKLFGFKAGIRKNTEDILPPVSFYGLSTTSINGAKMGFSDFKGKSVLIVNTASDCGYTNQLSDLKKLYHLYKDKLVILGFPSNDFKEQEKLSDKEIAAFCVGIFGVDFPLAQKSVVIPASGQNEVFKWLTDKNKNGWNDQSPEWNFSKYLINKKGILTHYFGPGVDPLSKPVIDQIRD
jgi:glutathione peroxidase